MKKIVCLLFCLVMALSVLAACTPEHEHTFDTKWMNDETDHWHQATCEHTEEVADKAPHVDENADDICDVCGYINDHTHTYETAWSWNATTHYHKNTCGHADEEKYRSDIAAHIDSNNDSVCDVCTYDFDHVHKYSTEWTPATNAADGHWHAASCGHDVAGVDLTDHVDANNDALCDECGWDYDHEHTYADVFSTDENEHWKEVTCGHDIPVGEKNIHKDEMAGDVAGQDGLCDICGYESSHFHAYSDKWTSDHDQHWHALSCHPELDLKADPAAHEGYAEDGICDICNHVVFEIYTVKVEKPDHVDIVSEGNSPLDTPFKVKEGTELVFYITIANNQRLEEITGAVMDTTPYGKAEDGTLSANGEAFVRQEGTQTVEYYLYKVTLTPTADTTIKITVNNLSALTVIIENGKVTIPVNDAFKYFTKTFDVEVPEAGTYVIYALNKTDAENPNATISQTGIQFDYASTPDSQMQSFSWKFKFEADGAGPVALKARYFSWNEEDVEVVYQVIKLTEEEMVLPTLTGSGYTLPTNIPFTVKLTLPEPGLYYVTSSICEVENAPMTWEGSLEALFVEATKKNQVVELDIQYESYTDVSFEFDWQATKIDVVGSLTNVQQPGQKPGQGDNAMTVIPGEVQGYTFTAPKEGYYSFDNVIWGTITNPNGTTQEGYVQDDSALVHAYWAAYKETLGSDEKVMTVLNEKLMKKGETVTFYAYCARVEGAKTETFTTNLQIAYTPYSANISMYGNTGTITAEPGYSFTFTNEAGDYNFTAPAGTQFSIDGGKTWVTSATEVELKNGASLTMLVKNTNGSSNKVSITVERIVYAHDLTIGEQACSFKPNRAYDVSLNGSLSLAAAKPYTLSWTDVNLVVSYNGKTLTSPADIDYKDDDLLTIQYNGTAVANVTLTVADRYEAPAAETVLYEGNNSVLVISGTFGKEMVFVADRTAEFVIKPTAGETNLKVLVDGVAVDLTEGYAFKLEQGASQAFKITTADGSNNAYVKLTIEEKSAISDLESDPLWALLTGSYEVYTEAGMGEPVIVMNLTPNADGTVTLDLTASKIYGYFGLITDTYTVHVSNGEATVINSEGSVQGWTFLLNEDGNLVLYLNDKNQFVLGEEDEYEEVEPVGDPLTTGNNYLSIADGYWGDKYYFTAPADGTYQFSSGDAADGALLGLIDSKGGISFVENMPYVIENMKAGQTINFAIATVSGDSGNVCLVIGQGSDSGSSDNILVVGSNELDIKDGYDGDPYTFTVPADGSYVLTAGANTQDPYLFLINDNGGDTIGTLPYTLENLTAGQVVNLMVATNSTDAGPVTVIITAEGGAPACEHTWADTWTVENGMHWYAPTCDCGQAGNQNEGYCFDWNEDTICDTCGTKMYDLYTVTLVLPEGSAMFDENYELSTNIQPVKIKSNNVYLPGIYLPNVYDPETLQVVGGTVSSYYTDSQWLIVYIDPAVTTGDSEITVTAEKLSNVAQQIASGTLTIEASESMVAYYKPLVFQADKAGVYLVTSPDYMPLALTEGGETSDSLTIEVSQEQAGSDITVYGVYTWYGYGSSSKEYSYSVQYLASNDIVLPGAVGSGYQLSNGMTYNLTVKLNGPGLYKVSTASAANWFLDGVNMYDSFIVEVEMDENYECYLNLGLLGHGSLDTFELDWSIVLLPVSYAELGQNAIWLTPYTYQGYQFYAPEGGAYLFTVESDDSVIYIWNGTEMVSQGNSCIVTDMQMNDAVTLYVAYYGELAEDAETAEDVMNIEALGYVPALDENTGVYSAMVGGLNAFVAPEKGGYKLTVTGGKISVDGTNWVSEVAEIILTENEILYYMVQADNAGATSVSVAINKLSYGFVLTPTGENTYTVRPGLDYVVSVSGLEYANKNNNQYKYQLSWPEGLDITVTDAYGDVIENGDVGTSYGLPSLTVYNNGQDAAEVAFVLLDKAPGSLTLVEGSQTVTLEAGKDYYVNLPAHETADDMLMHYILTWNNTDTVTVQYYTQVDGRWYASFVYSQAESGKEIGVIDDWEYSVLFISNTGKTDLQVSISVELTDGAGSGDEATALSVGENTCYANTWGDYSYSFTAAEAGTYTIAIGSNTTGMGWSNTGSGTNTGNNLKAVYTLEAGDTVSFYLYANSTDGDVTVTITKA